MRRLCSVWSICCPPCRDGVQAGERQRGAGSHAGLAAAPRCAALVVFVLGPMSGRLGTGRSCCLSGSRCLSPRGTRCSLCCGCVSFCVVWVR